MRSIEEVGLLQPITITPDGVLVCGWRRLEAVRRLGWRTLKVWVRSGISDQLSHLLAQQDENEQRKPLSPVETARSTTRSRCLEKEDAERRQAATQFGGAGNDGEATGAGESPAPRGDDATRSRRTALTGKATHPQRLEQINWIESDRRGRHAWPSPCASSRQHAHRDRQRRAGRSGVQAVKAAVELASKPPPADRRRAGRGHPARTPKRSSASRRRRTPSGCGRSGTRPSARHVTAARGRSP